jgi:hypothetical protein
MRTLIPVVLLLLAACAGPGGDLGDNAPSYSKARFAKPVDYVPGKKAADTQETQPGPITMNLTRKEPVLGYNPVPGLERMPFGNGMFGPWDPGTEGNDNRGALYGVAQLEKASGKTLGEMLPPAIEGAGLQVVFSGGADKVVPHAMINVPEGGYKREEALTIIRSICRANRLRMIHQDDIIIIRKTPNLQVSTCVKPSEIDGRYNVEFKSRELAAALFETSNATFTQVFLPPNISDPDHARKVSLTMHAAAPDEIYRRLAKLGGLVVEETDLRDGSVGYRLKWK